MARKIFDVLPAGSSATVLAVLSSRDIKFDFGIPQGASGKVTQSQLTNELSSTVNYINALRR